MSSSISISIIRQPGAQALRIPAPVAGEEGNPLEAKEAALKMDAGFFDCPHSRRLLEAR
jgi:hypothetical protein